METQLEITEVVIPDPLPPAQGSAFTTAERYDPAVKARVYDKFLNTDLTPSEIAIDASISVDVVRAWCQSPGWKKRKQEIEDELMEQAEHRYRKLLIQSRLEVTERHLRVSAQLENMIEKALLEYEASGKISDMALKRLAEALSSTTGVSARAAAVTERYLADRSKSTASERVPLVAIGINVQPAL